ncbi:hypothetical protein L596_022799 [Steinernema carpocapsae]|uniref:Uncharacterized protein n=1 Tax=Steinernema carpocapsae TaxID=34508 RepID=A0A4V6A0B8_STECR|nr:hypothetical protein L596_022799 [Steinernema carpocapsae]
MVKLTWVELGRTQTDQARVRSSQSDSKGLERRSMTPSMKNSGRKFMMRPESKKNSWTLVNEDEKIKNVGKNVNTWESETNDAFSDERLLSVFVLNWLWVLLKKERLCLSTLFKAS